MKLIVLTGACGSGKTTVNEALAGLLPPERFICADADRLGFRWSDYAGREFDHFIYEQPTPFVSHWIGEIAKYSHFQEVLREEWLKFSQTGFNGLDIDLFIDDFVESIRVANQADAIRWSDRSLDEQKDAFKYCIHKKIEWLDFMWNDR